MSYTPDPNQPPGDLPYGSQDPSWGPPPGYPEQPSAYGQQPPGYQPYPNQPWSNQPSGQQRLAGWWYRLGATIIDGVILGVLSGILGLAGTGGRLLGAIAGIVYYVVLIGGTGRTVGQMAVGTMTLDADTGTPIGYPRALLRWFVELALVLLLVIPWIVDILMPLWDSKNQTIHDKAASSVVVMAN